MENYLEILLETESVEEVLERYDLSPTEALMFLWSSGLIKEEYPFEEDNQND
jgi:hypothetical protein